MSNSDLNKLINKIVADKDEKIKQLERELNEARADNERKDALIRSMLEAFEVGCLTVIEKSSPIKSFSAKPADMLG